VASARRPAALFRPVPTRVAAFEGIRHPDRVAVTARLVAPYAPMWGAEFSVD
jgi:hypothetical protein